MNGSVTDGILCPAIEEVRARMATVRHKVLVLSGKGGVGKSTFTAHLAHGLAADENRQVGVALLRTVLVVHVALHQTIICDSTCEKVQFRSKTDFSV